MRIKVCGLTRSSDVEALDGLVDYLGFIVSPRRVSPRVLEPREAADLASTVSKSKPVLVAYGLEPGEALEAAAAGPFRVLQYHSPIKPRDAARLLREAIGVGLGLAVVVTWTPRGWVPVHPQAYSWSDLLREHLEYLLVDAAKGLRERYEAGLKIPLEVLVRIRGCHPRLGVAGGVAPGNACLVASIGGYWLIDVASGVESAPGVKSRALVEKLVWEVSLCSSRRSSRLT